MPPAQPITCLLYTSRLIEEEEQRREEEAAQGSDGYDDEYLEEAGIYPYGYMLWPVENHYLVTAEYGPRAPIPGVTQSTFHGGIDIGGCDGKPIRAAASGTVIQAGYNFNNGKMCIRDRYVGGYGNLGGQRDWSKLFIPFCRLCGGIDTSFRWERKANCIKYVGNTRIGFR